MVGPAAKVTGHFAHHIGGWRRTSPVLRFTQLARFVLDRIAGLAMRQPAATPSHARVVSGKVHDAKRVSWRACDSTLEKRLDLQERYYSFRIWHRPCAREALWSAVAAATAFLVEAPAPFPYGPRAEGGSCCDRSPKRASPASGFPLRCSS